jgi:hypothetical protein
MIIAMVDTIFSASNQSSFKFLPAFGNVHHVLLQHLDFYSNHATLFPAQVLRGIHENFILVFHLYNIVCNDTTRHDKMLILEPFRDLMYKLQNKGKKKQLNLNYFEISQVHRHGQ